VIYLALLLALTLQGVAGLLLWRWMRPQAGWVESLGMSLVLGTLLAVFSGILFQPVFAFGWAIPGLVGLFLWVFTQRRVFRVRPIFVFDRPLAIALLIGGVLAALSFALSVRSYPLDWEGSWSGFHGDMAFFEALGRSIPVFGVFDSIFAPGQSIHYHWLTYAWAGQLTTSLDLQPFFVLTRVVPLVTLVAGVTLIASWTRRLSQISWAPSLAVVLLLLGGHLGVVYGSVFNFDSPSQSLSVVWLIGFVVLLSHVWVSPYSRFGSAVVVIVVGLFSAGFMLVKVSTAAVAAAGIVALVLWQVIQHRRISGAQIWVAVAGLVPMTIAYFIFIAGGNGGGGIAIGSLLDRASSEQGMNPAVGIIGVALGTAILALGIGVRWVGTLWLATDRDWRARPEFAIGIGLLVAGVGAAIVLNGGQNELWFAAAAAGPLAALSAVGAGSAWEFVQSRASRNRSLVSVLVLISSLVVFVIVWVLWSSGPSGGNVWEPTLRWLGPITGIAVALVLAWLVMVVAGSRSFLVVVAVFVLIATFATAPGRLLGVGTGLVGAPPTARSEFYSVKPLEAPFMDREPIYEIPVNYLRAGEFLRFEGASGDRVITNLTYSSLVPALSGLQTLVSGTAYQGPYGPAGGEELLLAQEAATFAFLDQPSPTTSGPLCDEGVRWLWIDPRRNLDSNWQDFVEIRFSSDEVLIGELDQTLC
jgi:hypothetical protein